MGFVCLFFPLNPSQVPATEGKEEEVVWLAGDYQLPEDGHQHPGSDGLSKSHCQGPFTAILPRLILPFSRLLSISETVFISRDASRDYNKSD